MAQVAEKPVVEQAVAEKPIAELPAVEQPKIVRLDAEPLVAEQPVVVTPVAEQPEPQQQYEYVLSKEKMDWKSAQASCVEQGMNLASIADIDEHKTIVKMLPEIKENPYWIGLHEPRGLEGSWSWSDSTCHKFRLWDDEYKQPDNYEYQAENCALLYPSTGRKWHDSVCDRKANFVCKKCVRDCPTASCPVAAENPAPRE